MPLIENLQARSQTRLGKLTPKANQDRLVSGWGVVEGNAPPGWNGVGEMMDGIPIDKDGRKLLQFTEHKINGKTNDIKYGGMTLREMVAKREDVREADRFNGLISEQNVQREEQNVQNQELGQLFTKNTQSGYETVPQFAFGNTGDQTISSPEQTRRGWPKGKKRGPRAPKPKPTE